MQCASTLRKLCHASIRRVRRRRGKLTGIIQSVFCIYTYIETTYLSLPPSSVISSIYSRMTSPLGRIKRHFHYE